ncbi:MAG: hypothetical protein LBV50_12990 [Novosphingobium sp.]|jgi:hypothetical protein|nr:hypothetical protein [Novosphingobium sp.]
MIRTFLAGHRWLAIWLAGVALAMKVLVPVGFMPAMPVMSSGGTLVQLCTGQGPQMVEMDIPGNSGDHDTADHKKAGAPCAFSGLSAPTLASAGPVQMAIAIAFILAMGFLPVAVVRPALPSFLRPPPIGPPTTA